jgi:hypothetical protein
MPRPAPRTLALIFLAALGLLLALLFGRLCRDPEAAILLPRGEAQWIHLPVETTPRQLPTRVRRTRFRTSFEVATLPREARIELRALRGFSLRVNQTLAARSAAGESPWVDPVEVDVAHLLRPGRNTLRVDVMNPLGPPALLVRGPSLGLATGSGWEARERPAPGAPTAYRPAAPVRERQPFALSDSFPTSAESLRASAGLLAACFAAGFAATLAAGGRRGPLARADAGALRALLAAAWVLLCAHNLLRLPLHVGMDVFSHYRYVLFLVERAALPLATDGSQMFQPPLFYLIAAGPYLLFSRLFEPETAWMALRVVPMLAGLALLEIAYRSARLLFPDRRDLRVSATAVGGFLPMSLTLSQSFGNEPLAACLSALVVLAAYRLLLDPVDARLARRCLALGALFGAALLAKLTVLLLAPALALAVLWSAQRGAGERRRAPASQAAAGRAQRAEGERRRAPAWQAAAGRAQRAEGERRRAPAWHAAGGLALFALAAAALAGWYFLRNWIELGVPYVGGWDPHRVPATGRDLGWQYPGYRVPEDWLRFGRALLHPVQASLFGFWDGLHSSFWLDGFLSGAASLEGAPPWNYDLMLSLSLLSLPLAAAIGSGALRACAARGAGRDAVWLFSLLCVASLLAGMLWLHMKVPTWSNAKASYALGLAPCWAALAAHGVAPALRGPLTRALWGGFLASWTACVWGAHWG